MSKKMNQAQEIQTTNTSLEDEMFKEKVQKALKDLIPEHLTISVRIEEEQWNYNNNISVHVDVEYDGERISTYSDSFNVRVD